MEKDHIKSLDSFRFFAFFAVYLFHTNILGCGYLGVQAFFVLSGFLITPILLEMRQKLNLKSYLIVFYSRRALRIFPLYYGYLGILFIILLIFNFYLKLSNDLSSQIANQLPYALTYTYDFFHATTAYKQSYFFTHFWSLAIEEQFYLIWPFIIWFTPQYKIKKVLLFIIFFGPILRLFIYTLSLYRVISIIHPDANLVVYVLPFSHIDAFATGGFFACFIKDLDKNFVWAGLVGTISLGFGSGYFETGRFELASFGYPELMQGVFQFFWGYSIWNLTFAMMLCGLRSNQFLPSIFNNSVFQSLGKISYGLYVFHFPILGLLNFYGLPSGVFWVVGLATTIVVSHLSYTVYEKRFLKLKDLIFPKDSSLQKTT